MAQNIVDRSLKVLFFGLFSNKIRSSLNVEIYTHAHGKLILKVF